MSKTRFVALILTLALGLTVGVFALAAEGDYAYRESPFYIQLGGQFLDLNTKTQVKGDISRAGTIIDVDHDLGLDSSTNTWRVDLGWRFFDRHQLQFSYYEVNRDADKTLGRSFVYDGYDYTVGAHIHSELDNAYYMLKYNWYFVQGPRGEFGAQLGFTYSDIDASIRLDARGSGGGQQVAAGTTLDKNIKAPTATLGLAGTFQFTPKCFFRGEGGWLRLNVDGYAGTIYTLRATVDYFPWENVGFGGGYEYYQLKIEADKRDWDGYFKTGQSSLVAYVSLKF